jgi:hypothetical protein
MILILGASYDKSSDTPDSVAHHARQRDPFQSSSAGILASTQGLARGCATGADAVRCVFRSKRLQKVNRRLEILRNCPN